MPSNDDWQTLDDYVDANNGDEDVGTSLKSTSGWKVNSSLTTGTDLFGFLALPAGSRSYDGDFNYASTNAFFWSATETSNSYANYWYLYHSNGGFYNFGSNTKKYGFSVRCLKD